MNESRMWGQILAQCLADWESQDLREKTLQRLKARAARMATVCKKKHNHSSRCEVAKK